jgi:hypothetical protein
VVECSQRQLASIVTLVWTVVQVPTAVQLWADIAECVSVVRVLAGGQGS